MYFLFSLILHLALLFGMIFVWVGPKPLREKQPSMYVPSYTYQKPSQPAPTEEAAAAQPKKVTADKAGTAKQETVSTATQIRHATDARSSSSTRVADAIHLVGDKKTVPKPLIKLLGKALAAHLVYPKIAIDFKVRGMAFVGFVLHPDGTLTNIQLVQSSRAGVLDNEAVTAVAAISPLKDANLYVRQDKPMVVGIIFN